MPKQIVPVGGKPVLRYCLENLREIGVTSVGLVVGERDGQVERAIGDGSKLGLRISYILQESPLGLAHCITAAEEFLGSDDFLVYLGDNMLIGSLGDAAHDFRTHRPDAQILVRKVDDPRLYGVAELDVDGRVLSLTEKPEHPRSDLAVMGVYFFTPAIHAAVRRIRPSARGELEITDAIQDLLNRNRQVTAKGYPGYWADTGSIDGLLASNRVVLDDVCSDIRGSVDEHSILTGPVVIESGAEVVRSRLDGPVVVGPGSVIRDCRLGPHTAVGRDCLISAASVEESIVLDQARIEGIHGLRDSVIGRRAHVHATIGDASHRLLIGDEADVRVGAP
jgi:glucose-1-phosphate thymidylyltransferase